MVGRNSLSRQIEVVLGKDDQDFLHAAYQLVLRREPDNEGIEHYLAKMRAGVSKVEILDQLNKSDEARDNGVRLYGTAALARKARLSRLPVVGGLTPRSWNLRTTPHAAGDGPGHVVEAQSQTSPEAEQWAEQIAEVRAIAEGLSHAVKGLQHRNERQEQANAAMAAGHAAAVTAPEAEQLAEQISEVRAIAEGLSHAVQGLQHRNERQEQANAAMAAGHAAVADMHAAIDGAGDAIGGIQQALERHEAQFAALQIPGQGHLSDVLAGLGTAARSLETVVRRHEKGFAALREDLTAQIDSGVGGLRDELPSLIANLVAAHSQALPDSAIADRADHENAADCVAVEKDLADEEKWKDLTETIHAQDQTIRTMSLKSDFLDQKAHWIAVDNDNIRKRIEFIRKEIMLEVSRIGSREIGGGRHGVAAMPNADADGVAGGLPFEFPQDQPKRVNIGCGHLPVAGFANLDARKLPGVDIVADVRQLPFSNGSIDEMRATHVIEHFTELVLAKDIFPHWLSVLRPGGTLMVTAPNAAVMMRDFVEGRATWFQTKEVLMGGQEYEGDFHFSLLDPDHVCEMLKTAGFSAVRIEAESRANGDCVEFEVVATR